MKPERLTAGQNIPLFIRRGKRLPGSGNHLINGRRDFYDCIVSYTLLLSKKKKNKFLCKCDLTIILSHVKIFKKFFGGRGVVLQCLFP